jgi:5-methyltetrahydropteroyltriglutamate--homocysteine methyltransferase
MQKTKAKGAQSCLHLHNTSDELFWETKTLDMIESHVDDPFYQAKRTKGLLQSTDKFIKASIAATDFDQLIRNNILATSKQQLNENSVNEKIAETWKTINQNKINAQVFVENTELMMKRLREITQRFGADRILYSGPECGLRSFPTYESALECLRRVAQVVKTVT